MSSNPIGMVFAIQRMSVHDGPGWRTLVFLKGCPLRCRWCSNPESWALKPELAYNPARCLGTIECNHCIGTCPESAISEIKKGHPVQLFRNRCTDCGECVEECPAGALYLFGKKKSVAEIINSVEEDTVFHTRSEGGLTLGGGEPFLQPDFAADLLKQCREQGIHTSIETCGAVPWKAMKNSCRYVDTVHFDIKSADNKKHKAFTGLGNQKIIQNLEQLAKTFPKLPVTVRTPVVPGFNDTCEDIKSILQKIGNITSVNHYELLPYHRFGSRKYQYLGKKYPLGHLLPPSSEKIRELYSVVPDYLRFQRGIGE